MCGNCEYERKEFFKMELNAIEIKKDLYKNKSVATLHRYESGNLWYRIQTSFGNFEFPISVTQTDNVIHTISITVTKEGTNTGEMKTYDLHAKETKLSAEMIVNV